MRFSLKRSFLILLAASAGAVVFAASTQVSANKPIINFRLPFFTPEGYRKYLVRGSEANYIPKQNQIDIKDLTLSLFSGDSTEKLATMILSPTATVLPDESKVTGENSIRVINDDLEATGTGWQYTDKDKKIIIRKKVRVTINAEIKEFLK